MEYHCFCNLTALARQNVPVISCTFFQNSSLEIGDAAFQWEHLKKVLPVSSFISSSPI